jgi:hypothetical protein
MILTSEQILAFHKFIGFGNITTASIVIFGNEFGTATRSTQACISYFMNEFETKKRFNIGEGFSLIEMDPPPVSSTFLQFISRLMLALKHSDDRFFSDLTFQGKIVLNNYIMNSLYRENSAIINLRPLPQPTEQHWTYSNINEGEYHSKYNFALRNHTSDELKNMRLRILKEAFNLIAKESLVLGSGDKENKKAFFKIIYPTIQFHETKLSDLKIYYSNNPRIILSNYFDNRTIGLSGLKQLYHFILDFNQPKKSIATSLQLF